MTPVVVVRWVHPHGGGFVGRPLLGSVADRLRANAVGAVVRTDVR